MNSACRLMVAAGLAMVLVSHADAAEKKVPHGRTLVVGTKEAPPFSMKAADGAWTVLLAAVDARERFLRFQMHKL